MTRRTLLASAPLAAFAAPASGRLPIKKAVLLSMLPKELSYLDRFKLAREAGFEQIELPTITDQKEAEELKRASETMHLPVHSVMNMAHWKYPLSSADPAAVAESIKGMETSLRNAHFWGAETVLLVPGVVNPQTSYRDAWQRSTTNIKRLLDLATELKVIIAVENVWNKFLLSPIEFAAYVDQFKSPYLKAYFDIGNVLLTGYPQDWIRTLGPRIAKLHLKDFKFAKMVAEFVALREGQIDWKQVREALAEINYRGTATVELPAGDEAYLREVSHRVDLILEGA